ncbi:MAG: GAF domain-containing protein, partial [Chloroflexota bacterium]|nr:GAF domain-containing protein [Chloroflexota bacterium]
MLFHTQEVTNMFDENSSFTNEQEHQQLVTALRESEILRELAGLLASSLDINEILHILVKRATEVCAVERCAVWLLNEARSFSIFQPVTYHLSTPHFDETTLEAAKRVWNRWLLQVDDPLVQRLLSSEGMLVVEDLCSEPGMQKMAKKLLIKSVLLVPLIREGRPVGIIALDDPNTIRTFPPQQQQ